MQPMEINEDICRTGALHPGVRLLEVLFATERGTTSKYYVVGEQEACSR